MLSPEMISNDPGTKSLFRELIAVGSIDVVLDVWIWDGIQGWSYVFEPSDVPTQTDEELVALVKQAAGDSLADAEATVQRRPDAVFVNLVIEPRPTHTAFDPIDRRTPAEKAEAQSVLCEYLREHNQAQVVKAQQCKRPG